MKNSNMSGGGPLTPVTVSKAELDALQKKFDDLEKKCKEAESEKSNAENNRSRLIQVSLIHHRALDWAGDTLEGTQIQLGQIGAGLLIVSSNGTNRL